MSDVTAYYFMKSCTTCRSCRVWWSVCSDVRSSIGTRRRTCRGRTRRRPTPDDRPELPVGTCPHGEQTCPCRRGSSCDPAAAGLVGARSAGLPARFCRHLCRRSVRAICPQSPAMIGCLRSACGSTKVESSHTRKSTVCFDTDVKNDLRVGN